MSKFLFILAVTATFSSAAENAGKVFYTYRHKGEETRMEVSSSAAGPLVNDICLKKPQRCRALQVFQGKPRLRDLKSALPGNASGAYCELLGGNQLFARAPGAESDTLFCVFKDLTAVDARALYSSHFDRDQGGLK